MPSVYNYRHVELDKVGRGKRVIQPPGGQTADIFGSRADQCYSSTSSQAGSDVGSSSRVQIETDQQSLSGYSSLQTPVDGLAKHIGGNTSQASPGSGGSPDSSNQQPLLMAQEFKPNQDINQPINIQQQKLIQQQQQQQQQDVNRSPKKTIPVIRRNPITGEIFDTPSGQPAVVRVRQPPGGRSSGIF